uniref:N-acetyltransferase domain-containing protein n=1 Tax=Spongospora subterranea TaxID=70186 RepID=A0A0H5RJQ0_9EUKA|eukprot:CRZ08934.1 hypothetical protein [Spongospora subterranea]
MSPPLILSNSSHDSLLHPLVLPPDGCNTPPTYCKRYANPSCDIIRSNVFQLTPTSCKSVIRPATIDDAPGIAAVYSSFVQDITSPDLMPLTANQFKIKMGNLDKPWFVAVDKFGKVVGFCYASGFNSHPSFRWTVCSTVYISECAQRQGLGKRFYIELLSALKQLGYATVIATINADNILSKLAHRNVGFRHLATLPKMAYKCKQWLDKEYWFFFLQKSIIGEPVSASSATPAKIASELPLNLIVDMSSSIMSKSLPPISPSTMHYDVRPATIDDVKAIAAFHSRYDIFGELLISKIAEHLQSPSEHPWFVANDENGSVVGSGSCSYFSERPVYNWTVSCCFCFTDEALADGVGLKLANQLFAELCQRGFASALVLVDDRNLAIKEFLKSALFQQHSLFPYVGFNGEGTLFNREAWLYNVQDGDAAIKKWKVPIP